MTVHHVHVLELFHTVGRRDNVKIAELLELSAVTPEKSDGRDPGALSVPGGPDYVLRIPAA